MKNKGLCITCTNDKNCTFNRGFPVLYCEEFTDCKRESEVPQREKYKKQNPVEKRRYRN